jgi:hypothetical protein
VGQGPLEHLVHLELQDLLEPLELPVHLVLLGLLAHRDLLELPVLQVHLVRPVPLVKMGIFIQLPLLTLWIFPRLHQVILVV